MAVALSQARAAVNSINTTKGLESAYQSYAAGHDDKHRSKAKAYAYNHSSASGNEPSSFYQKIKVEHVPVLDANKKPVLVEQVSNAWGKTSVTMVPKTRSVTVYSDLSTTEELALLKGAFASGPPVYYQNRVDADRKFVYACYMPAGFAGYTFSGGGLQFPKQASACDAMCIVIAASGNTQIVTHYPLLIRTLGSWTKLV